MKMGNSAMVKLPTRRQALKLGVGGLGLWGFSRLFGCKETKNTQKTARIPKEAVNQSIQLTVMAKITGVNLTNNIVSFEIERFIIAIDIDSTAGRPIKDIAKRIPVQKALSLVRDKGTSFKATDKLIRRIQADPRVASGNKSVHLTLRTPKGETGLGFWELESFSIHK